MNAILQRIDQVIELYGSNHTRFASKIGMAQSTLSCIYARGDGKSIQPIAEATLQLYADVRKEWLLYGDEPMLRSQLVDDGTNKLIDIIGDMSETIKVQQKTIDKLTSNH